MSPSQKDLLCRYHYDPLDRLVDCTPITQASIQHFYQNDRLTTEIQGATQRCIFQQDDRLLAQQHHGNTTVTTLLATDQKRSVSHTVHAAKHHPFAYSPYGHCSFESGLFSLLGFNGERPDPVTGHYLLGKGYRAFIPVLMRFSSPDSLSPFGKGGLNAYAYCKGDPINNSDPTGHFRFPAIFKLKFWRSFFKTNKRSSQAATRGNLIGNYKKSEDTLKKTPIFQTHLQARHNPLNLNTHQNIEQRKLAIVSAKKMEILAREKATKGSIEFQRTFIRKIASSEKPNQYQKELTVELIDTLTELLPETEKRLKQLPLITPQTTIRRPT
ncbi:RHS repeat-associated core domain-containing protein [Pseudomonas sp. NFIX10]|uniref:RHS repeat-associated core domain-containing protein n=1 Tax=unclassified Pseudomonas TaxID=196821 RepID=UPI0008E89AAA|nr:MULTISPECIES: RHS repeat-associated core domain-containing protein [unclassified Pseudomonas]SFB32959.1 RHS repeat-associated core domain-containing protein [Pseudomonas sp. NFIX10]SFE99354.1 RHS repeat-associated core domain-containing protein [Pseudomonas sp. NFACC06-1]